MRANILNFAIGSAVIAGLFGCGGSTPPPTPPEPDSAAAPTGSAVSETPQPAEPATDDSQPTSAESDLDVPPMGATTDRIMKAHFKDALLIREAVIAGRPEDASNPATVIANIQNLDDLPKGWKPFVEHMQETARRITNSTTPAAVGAAAADLGISCGLCHQKLGGPKPSKAPAPAAGASMESRMQRHVWATERLWEALAVPAPASWDTGANALISEPFPADFLKQGGVDVRTSAKDLARLVAKAPQKKTVQDRAALYAELLITCGACHRATATEE
jgi:cytochrome c556